MATVTFGLGQLFWSGKYSNESGWWLSYTDSHGEQCGEPIEADKDASLDDLASKLAGYIGEIRVYSESGGLRGRIYLAANETNWRYA